MRRSSVGIVAMCVNASLSLSAVSDELHIIPDPVSSGVSVQDAVNWGSYSYFSATPANQEWLRAIVKRDDGTLVDVTDLANWYIGDPDQPNGESWIAPGKLTKPGFGKTVVCVSLSGTTWTEDLKVCESIYGRFGPDNGFDAASRGGGLVFTPRGGTPVPSASVETGVANLLNQLESRGLPVTGLRNTLTDVHVHDDRDNANIGKPWLAQPNDAMTARPGKSKTQGNDSATGEKKDYTINNKYGEIGIALNPSLAEGLRDASGLVDEAGQLTPSKGIDVINELTDATIMMREDERYDDADADSADEAEQNLANAPDQWSGNMGLFVNWQLKFLDALKANDRAKIKQALTAIEMSSRNMMRLDPWGWFQLLLLLGWGDGNYNFIPDWIEQKLRDEGIPWDEVKPNLPPPTLPQPWPPKAPEKGSATFDEGPDGFPSE